MSQNAHSHEDKLLEFAYGELPAPEARAVEAHLKSCTRCSGTLDSIRDVRLTMAKLAPEPPPSDGLASLLAYAQQNARRVQAGRPPKATWIRRIALGFAGVATVAIVAVVADLTVSDGWTVGTSAKQAAAQQSPVSKSVAEDRDNAQSPAALAETVAPPSAAPEAKSELVAKNQLRSKEPAKVARIASKPAPVEGQQVTRERSADKSLAVEVEQRQKGYRPGESTGATAGAGNIGGLGTKSGPSDLISKAKTAPSTALANDEYKGSASSQADRLSPARGALDQLAGSDRKADAPAREERPATASAPSLSLRQSKKQAPAQYAQQESNWGPGYGGQGGQAPAQLQPAAPPTTPAAVSQSNASPVPLGRAEKDGSSVEGLEAQANKAHEAGNYDDEIVALNRAVRAPNLSPARREDLLTRLCEAEEEVQRRSDATGCTQLAREFPASYSQRLATRRSRSMQSEKQSKQKTAPPAKASSKPTADDAANKAAY